MIGRLILLKLLLLGGQFRRSPWQVVGLVLAVLYGASITVLLVVLLIALRYAPVELARTAVVLLGSVAVLGSAVVPLLLGVDDTLDPRRFALLGMDRLRLAGGLIVAGLVGVPGLALVVVAFATVATWSRSPASLAAALVAAPLSVLLCILLSRTAAGLAGQLLSTRRSREAVSGGTLVALVLLGPAAALLANLHYGAGLLRVLGRVVVALSWTPLGATWAAPADAATGDAGGALARLAIGAGSVLALAAAWVALVARAMVTPVREGRPQTVSGLGWFGRLPATPLGAVAARSFTYWSRDVRYRVSALVVPITPVALVLVLGLVDVPVRFLALIPVPVVALFAGWLSHNDIAYDGTAVWLHVAAAVRGTADRLGRLAPVLAVSVPVLVAGSVVSGLVAGDPPVAIALIGVAIALLLGGMGFGAIASAVLPYPVPRAGESPFQQPNASGGISALVQSVLFVLQLVAAAPAAVLGLLGVLGAGVPLYWAALGAGVLVGLLVLWLGVTAGARVFERRGPELLAAALRA